jgi:hypothetical protein
LKQDDDDFFYYSNQVTNNGLDNLNDQTAKSANHNQTISNDQAIDYSNFIQRYKQK